MEDDEIRTLVKRLARPHASGGQVIERAAILAEGADSGAVLTWIKDNDWEPEDLAPPASVGGLHGARAGAARPNAPLRYVLPPGGPS